MVACQAEEGSKAAGDSFSPTADLDGRAFAIEHASRAKNYFYSYFNSKNSNQEGQKARSQGLFHIAVSCSPSFDRPKLGLARTRCTRVASAFLLESDDLRPLSRDFP